MFFCQIQLDPFGSLNEINMLLYSMVMAQNTLITLSQAVMFWCINGEHTVIICKECFEPWKGREKLGEEKEKALLPDAIFTLQHGEKCNVQSGHVTFRRAERRWPWCPGMLGHSWSSPAQHPRRGTQGCCFSGPWVHQVGGLVPPSWHPTSLRD